MGFAISVDHQSAVSIIRIRGELDLSTVPALDASLQQTISDNISDVIIDLRDCSYLDSEGIKALIRAYHRLGGDKRLSVRDAQGMVLRVLLISGIGCLLDISSSKPHHPND